MYIPSIKSLTKFIADCSRLALEQQREHAKQTGQIPILLQAAETVKAYKARRRADVETQELFDRHPDSTEAVTPHPDGRDCNPCKNRGVSLSDLPEECLYCQDVYCARVSYSAMEARMLDKLKGSILEQLNVDTDEAASPDSPESVTPADVARDCQTVDFNLKEGGF